MTRMIHATAIAALGFISGVPSIAQMVALPTIQLSQSARDRVETLACVRSHRVKADMILGYEFPTGVCAAQVRCKSHAMHGDRPLFFEAECERHLGRWSCQEQSLNVELEILGHPVAVTLDQVTPDEAIQIVGCLFRQLPHQADCPPDTRLVTLSRISKTGVDQFEALISGSSIQLQHVSSTHDCSYQIVSTSLVDY